MNLPKNPSPYLKMRVLGAIDVAEGKTINERIQNVSKMIFTDENGHPRQFTWRTIQVWRLRYNKYGLTTMLNKTRTDKGKTRKVNFEEVVEAIEKVMPFFHGPHLNKSLIYRTCIEKGFLCRQDISSTSFRRFLLNYDLIKNNKMDPEKREAWSKQFANQLWQADSMCGPSVKNNGQPSKTWLISFIDDASRIIPHAQFYFKNDTDSLIKTVESAVYKRGLPEQIYVDNGSNYISQEITLVCARIGILLYHAPVGDGAAKGKIERFFSTVRDCFLVRNLDLSSIDALNRQFWAWLENDYNGCVHSAIQMKPIDRFGLDLKRIKFLPPCQMNNELFFLEETRSVKKDNTFSFKNTRFESPRDFRNRKIQIRYARLNPEHVIVYWNNERMGEAKPLNTVLNDRPRKEKSS